jgi:hypothetical protein
MSRGDDIRRTRARIDRLSAAIAEARAYGQETEARRLVMERAGEIAWLDELYEIEC